MRYNDWQNDPLSEGNAGFTICARFDLNINNHTYPDVGSYPSGGIDSKVTSYSLYISGMEVHAQSGISKIYFLLFYFLFFIF